MSCTKIKDGIVCIGDDSFHCPHCGKEYNDEKYTDRIDRNKCGYTRVYCSCGKPFNVTVDFAGEMRTFLTHKQIIKKHQQKQALIDMMRGDEEIGLYDDNPKNH